MSAPDGALGKAKAPSAPEAYTGEGARRLRPLLRTGLWLVGIAGAALACGGRTAHDLEASANATPDDATLGDDELSGGGLGGSASPEEAQGDLALDATNAELEALQELIDFRFGTGSLLVLSLERALRFSCPGCRSHGTSADNPAASPLLGRLLLNGYLVPGSGAQNPLLQAWLEGQHPASESGARLRVGEAQMLASFLRQLPSNLLEMVELRASGTRTVEELFGCRAAPPVPGFTELHASMLEDVLAQAEADRPFLRYLSFSHLGGTGQCDLLLERERLALGKALNSTSLAPSIALPTQVTPLVSRIDIRDYGWNRPIDLEDDGRVDAEDGWQALAAKAKAFGRNPMAFEGPEPEQLQELVSTSTPWLFADEALELITNGDLYYSLTGVRQNLADTARELRLLEPSEGIRGAFAAASFSGPNEEVSHVRLEPQRYAGWFWSLRVESTWNQPSPQALLRQAPFTSEVANSQQAMSQLPNRLLAFIASDDDGNRVSEIPRFITLDVNPLHALLCTSNASDCYGCHADGALPAHDETRGAWQDYLSGIPADDRGRPPALAAAAQAYAIHPPSSEFQAFVDLQNDDFADLLDQLGIDPNDPEPIHATVRDHEFGKLGIARASAYLGVSPERLRSELPRMDPRLLEIEDEPIDIHTFRDAYHDSLCLLHGADAVRPMGCK